MAELTTRPREAWSPEAPVNEWVRLAEDVYVGKRDVPAGEGFRSRMAFTGLYRRAHLVDELTEAVVAELEALAVVVPLPMPPLIPNHPPPLDQAAPR